jgi:hypothetical protein
MSKHTPGPWSTLHNIALGSTYIVSNPEKGLYIATIEIEPSQKTYAPPKIENEANARLIAAAPELLEMVIAYKLHHKLMLQVTDDCDCPCSICKLAETAIKKAKGE